MESTSCGNDGKAREMGWRCGQAGCSRRWQGPEGRRLEQLDRRRHEDGEVVMEQGVSSISEPVPARAIGGCGCEPDIHEALDIEAWASRDPSMAVD